MPYLQDELPNKGQTAEKRSRTQDPSPSTTSADGYAVGDKDGFVKPTADLLSSLDCCQHDWKRALFPPQQPQVQVWSKSQGTWCKDGVIKQVVSEDQLCALSPQSEFMPERCWQGNSNHWECVAYAVGASELQCRREVGHPRAVCACTQERWVVRKSFTPVANSDCERWGGPYALTSHVWPTPRYCKSHHEF